MSKFDGILDKLEKQVLPDTERVVIVGPADCDKGDPAVDDTIWYNRAEGPPDDLPDIPGVVYLILKHGKITR